jgi:hypothetical protein
VIMVLTSQNRAKNERSSCGRVPGHVRHNRANSRPRALAGMPGRSAAGFGSCWVIPARPDCCVLHLFMV